MRTQRGYAPVERFLTHPTDEAGLDAENYGRPHAGRLFTRAMPKAKREEKSRATGCAGARTEGEEAVDG